MQYLNFCLITWSGSKGLPFISMLTLLLFRRNVFQMIPNTKAKAEGKMFPWPCIWALVELFNLCISTGFLHWCSYLKMELLPWAFFSMPPQKHRDPSVRNKSSSVLTSVKRVFLSEAACFLTKSQQVTQSCGLWLYNFYC